MSRPSSCAERAEAMRIVRRREEDLASPAETARLASHLAGCAACRDEALSVDPTLLFLPLAVGPSSLASPEESGAGQAQALPSVEGKRLAGRVRAALDVERARRRVQPASRWTGWRRAAALAAALAGLAIVAELSDAVRPLRLARVQVASGPERPGTGAAGGAGEGLPAELSASLTPVSPRGGGASGPAAPIELVASPGAKVYQFSSSSRLEPTVVFVVDRNADL